MKIFSILCLIVVSHLTYGQSNMPSALAEEIIQLPYAEIPDYPESYTANNVAARLIDGLGFRYYWATEGLREEDLNYKPSEEARNTSETIDHLYGLCRVINNAVNKTPNGGSVDLNLTFEQKRTQTLLLIKETSDILKKSYEGEMDEFMVIFQRGDSKSEFPFWNLVNGPIADAIWHCGQVVSLRRASGNPFNSKVSVFSGKVRK